MTVLRWILFFPLGLIAGQILRPIIALFGGWSSGWISILVCGFFSGAVTAAVGVLVAPTKGIGAVVMVVAAVVMAVFGFFWFGVVHDPPLWEFVIESGVFAVAGILAAHAFYTHGKENAVGENAKMRES